MSKEIFFFDTYAFFEVIGGNPKYSKYLDCECITTIFNLAELNYNLKKEKDKKAADAITEKYEEYEVDVTIDDVKEAMDMKQQNKKLSIPDVIGYIVAKRHGVKFLTGDEGFRNITSVEFVK